MAFKKTVQTSFGVEVKDAYHRIEGVRIIAKDKIAYQLRVYADTNFESFKAVAYESAYVMSGENPIKQAYEHLKTLEEFSSVVNC